MTVQTIDPDIDALPKLLLELRDDETVRSIVGPRVRIREAARPVIHPVTKEILDAGDTRGPGEYVPFVVLVRLGDPPHPTVPISTSRVLLRCYGADSRQATVLRRACMAALHNREPRVYENGLVIYATTAMSGGSQDTDPNTGQPLETLIVEAVAGTQVLTA